MHECTAQVSVSNTYRTAKWLRHAILIEGDALKREVSERLSRASDKARSAVTKIQHIAESDSESTSGMGLKRAMETLHGDVIDELVKCGVISKMLNQRTSESSNWLVWGPYLGEQKACRGERSTGPMVRMQVTAPKSGEYKQIVIPKEHRQFFPGYQVNLVLETDCGTFNTHIIGGSKRIRQGNTRKGNQLSTAEMGPWLSKHTEFGQGSWLTFTRLNDKLYRLEIS